MLTEDEMKLIAAEERYRHSIRKSLEEESAAPAPAPRAACASREEELRLQGFRVLQ